METKWAALRPPIGIHLPGRSAAGQRLAPATISAAEPAAITATETIAEARAPEEARSYDKAAPEAAVMRAVAVMPQTGSAVHLIDNRNILDRSADAVGIADGHRVGAIGQANSSKGCRRDSDSHDELAHLFPRFRWRWSPAPARLQFTLADLADQCSLFDGQVIHHAFIW
jgi:hypothetical protein